MVKSILDTSIYFETQKDNINKYFSYLKKYEESEGKVIINTYHKSSFILLLYNFTESITTKILIEIHNNVLNGINLYCTLNNSLRRTIFTYNNKITHNQNIDKYFLNLENLFTTNKIDLSYKDMSKKYPLFSGNLDARAIRNVLKNKYGFSFQENELQYPALQKIKNGRNELAHGEVSFDEYGARFTIGELKEIKEEVFIFFKMLLEKVDMYLNEKLYLKN